VCLALEIRGSAVEGNARVRIISPGDRSRGGCSVDSRNARDPLDHIFLERQPTISWKAQPSEIRVRYENPVLAETCIQSYEVARAADEQQSANEQHEGKRNL